MGTFEILAIAGAILSGLFFVGALIWAVRSFSRKKTDDEPRHIYQNNTFYPGQSNPTTTHQEITQSHLTGKDTPDGVSNLQRRDFISGAPAHQPLEDPVEYSPYSTGGDAFPDQESYGSFFEEENIHPKKGMGYPAASKASDMSEEEFYKIEGYDFETDLHGIDGKMEWESDTKNLPSVVSADGKMPKIEKRDRPQKRILDESVRCNICLGYIKTGLPLITCVCGKNYHISCGSRVEECPICHNDMLEYEDLLLGSGRPEGTDREVEEGSSREKEFDSAESLDDEKDNEDDDQDNEDDDDNDKNIGMSPESMEKGMNILEKDQMERLKRLLKKYNLDNNISDRASLKVLRKK